MDLKQIAEHEAGHAVVAFVLGLTCNEVAMTHDEVNETGVYGYAIGPDPRYGYHHDSQRELNATLHAKCVACCAGLAAENVFRKVPLSTDNEDARGDFQNIIQCERYGLRIRGKRSGFPGDESTWRYIERQLVEARRLVKRHRDAVERVAATLIKKKKLTSNQVTRLLRELIPESRVRNG